MKKINVNAPINSTGYGIASINILKYLSSLMETTLFPIGSPAITTQEEFDLYNSLTKNMDYCDVDAPVLKIWHQFDLLTKIGHRGQYLAFPFFELDKFSDREKTHLKVPDTILATSEWAKNIVIDNIGECNVKVVPLGVDNKDIFNPEKYNSEISDKYIFVNIGKWEIRKGHDILLETFKKAFPNNENVELWVLAPENTNSYSNQQETLRWKNMYTSDPRVKVFTGFPKHEDVAQFINNANCGIFLSRAEGWNLELLECMAMNKPVIATNCSAHTEFCNDNNAFLVRTNGVEKAYDGKAFVGQGNWAKFDQNTIDDAIEKMRHVFSNRITTNENGLITANKYSWENTANTIVGCIE